MLAKGLLRAGTWSRDCVRGRAIVAIVYMVKTLLVGIAWLVVPDLPQRAMTKAREAWSSVSGKR